MLIDFTSDVAISELAPQGAGGALDCASVGRRHKFRFPYAAAGYVCASVDALIIAASSVLGCFVYQLFTNTVVSNFDSFAYAGSIAAVLYLWMAHAAGFYHVTTIVSSENIYRRIVKRWLIVGFLLSLLAFLLQVGAVFSRGSIVSFITLTPVLLITWRWLAERIFSGAIADGMVKGRRVVLVGSREELASIDDDSLLTDFGLTELDRIILPHRKLQSLSLCRDQTSALNRALDSARLKVADEIVLAISWNDRRRIDLVRSFMRSSPLPVQLLPDRVVRTWTRNTSFGIKPSLVVEMQRGPLSQWEQAAKRLFDILGASFALMLLLPVMLVTGLMIKLDSPGPIFFRQRRNGFNAKQFYILKFRTMTVNEDGDQVVQATRFDKRVTRVGRLLRQASLDELPQLFNVLKGEMSLVGPRPHALSHDDKYGELLAGYALRHHVTPGITGWAQVNGFRGETPRLEQMQRRVELDLWYINHWSLLLDIKILLGTCFEVVRARNAH